MHQDTDKQMWKH